MPQSTFDEMSTLVQVMDWSRQATSLWGDHHTSINSYPQCRIYASANRINFGSDNDLSPIRRQTLILTKAGVSLRNKL